MDNGNSSQSTMTNQKTHFKKFLHIFIPVTLLIIILSIVLYQRELSAHRGRVTTREMRTLENRRETVTNLLKSVVADLRILTSLQEMQALPEGASEEDAAALAAELLTFSTYRDVYDQVSFIDRQGMEIIRVDYHNGKPALVPRLELQLQKNSPCFQDAFRLQAGEFHMSHFDLGMEKGKITYPPTPVICFGMPVFDRSDRRKGVIMVNYLGDQLLQALKNPGEDDRQSLFLLNSEGYWLLGPSPQVEWGFLYPDRKEQTLKARFPDAWNEICAGENGHFADTAGIFIFITLYPPLSVLSPARAYLNSNGPCGCSVGDKDKYYWKLVSFIPTDFSSSASSFILLRRMLFIDGLLFLLAGALSWLLAGNRKEVPEVRKSA